ncbi:hypothetical protein HHI36_008447 [Cryptolaemus montrouzieri]|uniref:Mpv17-like protein 2 n=1 Tax=Cryptolaemus montrouzieri TaxID=559131 RepID=A0ABD2MT16_9CUCU
MVDQLLMGPVCIVFFFSGMGLLEGKTVNNMKNEIKNKFLDVYLVDWCIWPPSQFINFYYVPVRYQVLYINFLTFLYDAFLSYVKHKDHVDIIEQHGISKVAEKQK